MTRKHILAACLVFVVLTLAIGGLGYRAKADIESVVTGQFNRQQLILAQQIAKDIDDHFAFLRTCLQSLSLMWRADTAPGNGTPWLATPALYDIFAEWNVVALGEFRPGRNQPVFYDPAGRTTKALGLCEEDCRALLADPKQTGRVTVTRVFVPTDGPFAGRRLTALILPLTDDAGGRGGLVLVVDAMAVAARYAHNVRSGNTGYAWVVDDTGMFLDHFEKDFLGRDSLEARRLRDPSIDWSRLTTLLRDRILAGDKGTDWYLSGWHRGRLGQVRKLVAFCPVFLSGSADPGNRWSVALAAPQDEVQGLIGRLLVRQWLLVGLFELVVFAGFVLTLHLALRWSKTLSREVDAKSRELLAAQEKLLRSERFAAIGEAAARLSHEIKNPLMLMGGFASQVRRHLPHDGGDFEKLGIVEAEAKRLEGLLGEVRDFTRPAPAQIALGDLNTTVEESVALLAEATKTHNIRLVQTLDRSLPQVPHDPARIKQVLLNLLKNATEAMGNGGTLTVTSSRANGRARITVTDTGGGIPEAVRDRVFDPFCTTKETGTGLGLTVCQRIVADHHGEIRHAPTPDGTTFTVELPLEQ